VDERLVCRWREIMGEEFVLTFQLTRQHGSIHVLNSTSALLVASATRWWD